MENSISRKKILNYIGIVFVFAGVFILSYPVRKEIVSIWSNRTYIWGICWISWLGFLLLSAGNAPFFKNKKEWVFMILPLLSLIPLTYNILKNGQSLGFVVLYSSCCVFPLYFIFIKLDRDNAAELVRFFLILFDACVIIMVIWAVIDTGFDKIILRQIAPLMKTSPDFMNFAYPEYLDQNRFYSLWGHPVLNATIFNMFYVLNIAYIQDGNKGIFPGWLICLISLAGVGCCGSKTGIVVAIAITLLAFYRDKRLLIVAGLALALVFISGLGKNIIVRFLTQPLTTGRAGALRALLADKSFRFSLFHGYGDTGAAVERGYNAAFEFPLIKFSFNYGIIFAIIILGTFLAYVTYKLCRKETLRSWLLWGLIFAEVNTYSTFAEDRDNFMIFCIFTMILLNINYGEKQVENNFNELISEYREKPCSRRNH